LALAKQIAGEAESLARAEARPPSVCDLCREPLGQETRNEPEE
jgi:hypothetical protein